MTTTRAKSFISRNLHLIKREICISINTTPVLIWIGVPKPPHDDEKPAFAGSSGAVESGGTGGEHPSGRGRPRPYGSRCGDGTSPGRRNSGEQAQLFPAAGGRDAPPGRLPRRGA